MPHGTSSAQFEKKCVFTSFARTYYQLSKALFTVVSYSGNAQQ